MKGYHEVGENILEYFFVRYHCYSTTCSGQILISLDNLYNRTRTQCPICKRECTLYLDARHLKNVQREFGYLYKQLRNLELLPLAFSLEVAPKTAFVDSKPQDNTLFSPIQIDNPDKRTNIYTE